MQFSSLNRGTFKKYTNKDAQKQIAGVPPHEIHVT